MMITAATHLEKTGAAGAWFFWITIIIQLTFMSSICVLFLFELETLLTLGKDRWPLAEMIYCGVFVVM
jgi:hypothetical protein